MRILYFILILSFFTTIVKAQNYSIFGKVEGMPDGEVLLGYYYGDKQYVKDTVKSHHGFFHFESDENLESGVYFILLPEKQHFQIILDETRNFSFETKISDLVGFMEVKGSHENQLFYNYQKFSQQKSLEANPIRRALETVKEGSKKHKKLKIQLESINDEVTNFKADYIKKNPSTFFVKLLKAMEPIFIPDTPRLKDGEKDKNFRFQYYNDHLWDHFDLEDDRMIRTPIFHNMMEKYLQEHTLQIPDSINASLDALINKARKSQELFKYIINWSTHHYESSKIMGQDAVFVHLVFTYFVTGQTPWIDEVQMTNIINKAMRISPNLIGTKAPFISIPDDNGVEQDLHKIEAPFTVLFFYDPDCGHCKTEAPKVKETVESYADKGVKVYAVCTEFDEDMWKSFIIEQGTNDWINVIDLENKSNFRGKYNVMGTPRLYLLDSHKKIIAKQISSEALAEILENEFKLIDSNR
jgi:thiol-disulfide isomerase/thioredoxin